MSRYYITLALASATVLCACGGGGSDEPIDEVLTVNLQAWETDSGVCSFASEQSSAQAAEMGAACNVVMIGNTVNGQTFPAKVW